MLIERLASAILKGVPSSAGGLADINSLINLATNAVIRDREALTREDLYELRHFYGELKFKMVALLQDTLEDDTRRMAEDIKSQAELMQGQVDLMIQPSLRR